MVLPRTPVIMRRGIMTGGATVATKPIRLMSGKTWRTTNLTHCWKSRVSEKMMMFNKISLTMSVNEGEAFFRKCYNCSKPGHPWCDCKKPLKPALRLALNSEIERKAWRMEKKQLNPNGGARAKGGRASPKPLRLQSKTESPS